MSNKLKEVKSQVFFRLYNHVFLRSMYDRVKRIDNAEMSFWNRFLEGNVQKRPRYKTLDSLYHEEFGEWGEFILEQEVFPDKFCNFLKLKVAFDLFKLDSDSIKNLDSL